MSTEQQQVYAHTLLGSSIVSIFEPVLPISTEANHIKSLFIFPLQLKNYMMQDDTWNLRSLLFRYEEELWGTSERLTQCCRTSSCLLAVILYQGRTLDWFLTVTWSWLHSQAIQRLNKMYVYLCELNLPISVVEGSNHNLHREHAIILKTKEQYLWKFTNVMSC